MTDVFSGAFWITNETFKDREIRNVFHRQLEKKTPDDEIQNQHILFRKKINVTEQINSSVIHISADDYYKLYINGVFVAQGPAPGYPDNYNYNTIDVSSFLKKGENTIAVHTYYQGLINRVWVSGDCRHGLILSLNVNGKNALVSDESFLTKIHSGFSALDMFGYHTQFAQQYDSRCAEDRFFDENFDDSSWEFAKIKCNADYRLIEQKSSQLVFDEISPVICEKRNGRIFIDFGEIFVGYLCVSAKGRDGQIIDIHCGQELNDDGTVRSELRCRATYEEKWILSGKTDTLNEYDYKSFRYAEIISDDFELISVKLNARHYPFELKAHLKEEYRGDALLCDIWKLCTDSLKWGVQEVIQDCMDREKGFYLGDGCYTAITHFVLTKDDSMVRKLIDDSFHSAFITDGLVTCADCSFMQEIAEYPLILIDLIFWHYNLTGNREYLLCNYNKAVKVLESFRKSYEDNFLVKKLDKWCVVEWPKNFQDGYAVDIAEGKVCEEAHVSINAYYINAVNVMNIIADIIGVECYHDAKPLIERFYEVFYLKDKHLFRDGENHDHISYVGNLTCYAFGLSPDDIFIKATEALIRERGMAEVSMFCSIFIMRGLLRNHHEDLLIKCIKEEGTYSRMLSEGATRTFESWYKEGKWNTSLFHLTFSYAALFLCDEDIGRMFG